MILSGNTGPTAPETLTLLCQNKILGYVSVRQSTDRENGGRRIVGVFLPGPDYSDFADICRSMAEWEDQYHKSAAVNYTGNVDPYWAWDRWMDAITALGSLGLTVEQGGIPVEEFSLDHERQTVLFL